MRFTLIGLPLNQSLWPELPMHEFLSDLVTVVMKIKFPWYKSKVGDTLGWRVGLLSPNLLIVQVFFLNFNSTPVHQIIVPPHPTTSPFPFPFLTALFCFRVTVTYILNLRSVNYYLCDWQQFNNSILLSIK